MPTFNIDFLIWLGQNLGLLGAFAIGLLSSFTIFIPSPAFLAVIALAPFMNPVALGVAAGLGSAVGELTSFGLGYGARKLLMKKYKKDLKKIEKLFQKYNGWVVIFVFAATPLPFDIVGIFCGNIGYPFKKFMIPTIAGKLVKYLFLAFVGYYGIQWLSSFFVLS